MNMSRVEHCTRSISNSLPPRPVLVPTERVQDLARTYQMRPPQLVYGLCVIQFDIQVLIHALQRAAYAHLVLELDGDFVVDEGFEETIS